jgi:hypothetical protein
MPLLVRDMIERAIRAQTDMVVAEIVSTGRMYEASRRTRPHLIVVGLGSDGLPPECDSVLSSQPDVKILGIESTGGSALLYELAPRRQALGQVSPKDVVTVIRSAGARPLFAESVGKR